MDSQILSALIGTFGIIIGSLVTTIIGPIVARRFQDRRSLRLREREKIPDILGEWNSDWYVDGELLHDGIINLSQWDDDSRVSGHGEGRSREGFSISGKVDASRVFVFTYRSINYPTVGYIGVGILEISLGGDSMSGTWTGRTSVGEYVSDGTIHCNFRKPPPDKA